MYESTTDDVKILASGLVLKKHTIRWMNTPKTTVHVMIAVFLPHPSPVNLMYWNTIHVTFPLKKMTKREMRIA